jgi:hypothetical protein
MEEQRKLLAYLQYYFFILPGIQFAAIFPQSANITSESTSRSSNIYKNYQCMKPKVTISICVGYERGTCKLVWPVNLQPSSRSLPAMPRIKVN